jgi:hypothetical protein
LRTPTEEYDMPETKQRRRSPSSNAVHKPKPNISRPRRTSAAKRGPFSRFRAKPAPTGMGRVLGALGGAKPGSKKGGAAAAGGLALLAGGLATLRKHRGGTEAPAPGPVTSTGTPTHEPANGTQPVGKDGL